MPLAGEGHVQLQWQHHCTRKHHSYEDMARCAWNMPVAGSGPYAIVPSRRDGVVRPNSVVRLALRCPSRDQSTDDEQIYKLMLSV